MGQQGSRLLAALAAVHTLLTRHSVLAEGSLPSVPTWQQRFLHWARLRLPVVQQSVACEWWRSRRGGVSSWAGPGTLRAGRCCCAAHPGSGLSPMCHFAS
ncbi:hypothetical protein HaLaN_25325 [Haematococcus lacustris]|uniref:Secreted protein n=1 Tax=Haematococcus lacustris TaxID=44745 RepID=A0A6A0A3G6_HAELA|nr:hypothetical protein HaLaN_25325 [Haematococcus lacustris]